MNGPDQAFISAYNDAPLRPANQQAQTHGEPEKPGGYRGQPADPAIQASSVKRYRIDARSPRRPVPAPHADFAPNPAESTSGSVQVSMWDTHEKLPADSQIVSSSMIVIPSTPEDLMEVPLVNDTAAAETGDIPAANPEATEAEATELETTEETATEKSSESTSAAPKDTGPPETNQKATRPEAERPEEFKPIWEVDRLAWPTEGAELYETESTYFRHAGEKLKEACSGGLKVLAITSAKAREGCTTLAMCLARAAANAGVRVVLMDANFARPNLAKRLGIKFPHGWQAAITGEIPLGETAIASLQDGVTLLPLSARTDATGMSLGNRQTIELIRTVAAGTDLVVIDSGKVGVQPELTFEEEADCPIDATIVVRNVLRTSETETLKVARYFKELGVAAVGIAENFVPDNQAANRTAAAA